MALTLSEAKKSWRISDEKLCQWLEYGFIPEVELNNGIITVGEKKPFVPRKNANITVENVRKYILTACENLEYIDFHILCITAEQFIAILLQLEEKKYVQRNLPDADCKSNKYFTITEDGEKFLKKKKFKLEKLNFTFKFKFLEFGAEINGGE